MTGLTRVKHHIEGPVAVLGDGQAGVGPWDDNAPSPPAPKAETPHHLLPQRAER